MELLLIRHGLPARIDDVGGPADPPLAATGVQQAESLAGWLAPIGLDAVYSSPMRRARETAVPLAQRLGVEVQVDDGLEEFDAHLHFYVPLEEMTHDDPRWHQLVAEWSSPEFELTRQEFRTRVVAAVERIAGGHRSQRVALVCHGGVINAYLSHVLGMDRPSSSPPTRA